MARRAAAAAAARLLRRLGPLAAEPPVRGDLVWYGGRAVFVAGWLVREVFVFVPDRVVVACLGA